MPKTFYTERDIEDLAARGVDSLQLTDDVVVTDQARERAGKLGLRLVRGTAVVATPVAPAAKPTIAHSQLATVQPAPATLEQRVLAAVQAKLGGSVDAKLLETIVKRVLQNVGGK